MADETDDITRVLIAANYASLRAGLHALLAGETHVCVLGESTSDAPALSRLLPSLTPDVVLLDTSGDGASGTESLPGVLELLARANKAGETIGDAERENAPAALVVLGDAAQRDIVRLFAAENLPGWAYLLRETADGPQIARATRAAASGLVVLDKSISPISSGFAQKKTASPSLVPVLGAARLPEPLPGETLTPRETEVLQLMAQGLPNKIIAARLKISLHTAKFHVAQILGKLAATSRTEAVTIGARRGYVIL